MMNRMTLIGGLIGFGLAVLVGMLSEGVTWPGNLLRGCIGALAGGLLLRRWAGLFARSNRDTNAEPLASDASSFSPKVPGSHNPPNL
jgi:uncharacterized membrane protein YeaQ/YmgE (transglycosylase-associated protein family)